MTTLLFAVSSLLAFSSTAQSYTTSFLPTPQNLPSSYSGPKTANSINYGATPPNADPKKPVFRKLSSMVSKNFCEIFSCLAISAI